MRVGTPQTYWIAPSTSHSQAVRLIEVKLQPGGVHPPRLRLRLSATTTVYLDVQSDVGSTAEEPLVCMTLAAGRDSLERTRLC
jgi:hypothetical protein